MQHLLDFEFWSAFTCPYANSVGFLTLGLIVYGAVAIPSYLVTNSIIIPFVLLLIIGPVVMAQVASPAVAIATVVLLVGGAGSMVMLYRQYSR